MAQHPFRYSLLCGAALLAMTPGLAQATVVVTGTFADQNAGNFGDGTGSVAVTVNEFNPATEGALSGIVITLTTSATDSFETSNSGDTSLTFSSGNLSGTVSLTFPTVPSLTVSDLLSATGFSGTATANTPDQLFPGSNISTTASTNISSTLFNSFTGTGSTPLTFDIAFSGFAAGGQKQAGAGTALTFGATGSLSGTVTVTYETVPEPASMSLIGGGLVGLGILRRRKNRSVA